MFYYFIKHFHAISRVNSEQKYKVSETCVGNREGLWKVKLQEEIMMESGGGNFKILL
jgi:hypothetical protein